MNTDITFYRPKWTCGRYDERTHSALYYNLLSGLSYFFEDESADVVGLILDSGRGGFIDTALIESLTGIRKANIESFMVQLCEVGLVTDSKIDISGERARLFSSRQQYNHRQVMSADPMQPVDAERDYLTRTNSRIFSVLIELTYNCSEKCIHCYNPGATRNNTDNNNRSIPDELDLKDYKRIIDEFYEQGLVRVCLSGGDPFAKPKIWEIIEYLYSKEIAFDVYTNGIQLNGQEQRLADLFPCSVGISLYSDQPLVHDAITRVPHSLEKSMEVVDRLAALSVPLSIKCCVMRNNIKSYRGVAKIADKYSATLQLECNIFDSVDGDQCVSKFLRLNREEMMIVLRDKDIPQYVGPEVKDYGAKTMPANRNTCAAGESGFCITPDGYLTLCVSFQSKIGNLKKESLVDILSSSKLNWWLSRKFTDYEDCGRYDYCNFCCLCPGLNFAAHGTPLKPCDCNCYFAKVRHELAESLKAGLDPLNGKCLEDALDALPEVKMPNIGRIQSNNYYKTEFPQL